MSFLLTVLLLVALPMLRKWLWEKRTRAAAGRTFRYYLTNEQRKRRTEILRRYQDRAQWFVDGVGAIFEDRRQICENSVLSVHFYAGSLMQTATYWREDFCLVPICHGGFPGRYWWAILVDERDERMVGLLEKFERDASEAAFYDKLNRGGYWPLRSR